uniref:Uncharacterized protein n=1 Tax=Romanomermis culicivorax TaxID=13658 RepID=A0A915IME1_ROMCU
MQSIFRQMAIRSRKFRVKIPDARFR